MPVELGYTVVTALKKSFRLPSESMEPDPPKISEFKLQDRLEYIFNKIKLDENKYSYHYDRELNLEDWKSLYNVEISGLEDEYYILLREGGYDKADYDGDPDKKYDDYLYDSVYKRFGNRYRRRNIYDDNLILVFSYFEGGDVSHFPALRLEFPKSTQATALKLPNPVEGLQNKISKFFGVNLRNNIF